MPNIKHKYIKYKFSTLLSILSFFMFCSSLIWANEPIAGKDYIILNKPVKTAAQDKIEVIEFFWYGCPHCYDFESYLKNWLKNKPDFVDFKHVAAPLGGIWDVHARAFYTAETMNILDKTHQATFNAIHQAKKNLITMDQIKNFYQTLGIDSDKFKQTANSFIVDVRLRQAKDLVQRYQLEGVPAITVNGKYLLSPAMNGGNTKTIEVLNYLIAKEKAS